MGKRSSFERRDRDYYPTPYEAVLPLVPHLEKGATFIEPCCGDGRLVSHLIDHGLRCECMADIEPINGAWKGDATCDTWHVTCDYFITNPPWRRDVLHPIILNLSEQKPTWLLFDADWMHTKQAGLLLDRCRQIVSIGRVKWIEGSKMTGKDNCCWYLFDKPHADGIRFFGKMQGYGNA